ncbi:hypothetical protein [Moorena sp. SIOASIH]|uniref:hypothetical protein n=1 Tax=Moorena sp. SIOASIH TaxID=2607817 RepID=UPI0025E6D977|nr:hypothetical protein [Moorena sp. SIOASIH]
MRCSFRAATRTQNSMRSPHLPTPPTIPDSRFPIPDSRFPTPDSRFPIPYLQIYYRFRTQLGITYYG